MGNARGSGLKYFYSTSRHIQKVRLSKAGNWRAFSGYRSKHIKFEERGIRKRISPWLQKVNESNTSLESFINALFVILQI
jgi:hypothetical protein